jgi:hypothetical protein
MTNFNGDDIAFASSILGARAPFLKTSQGRALTTKMGQFYCVECIPSSGSHSALKNNGP